MLSCHEPDVKNCQAMRSELGGATGPGAARAELCGVGEITRHREIPRVPRVARSEKWISVVPFWGSFREGPIS